MLDVKYYKDYRHNYLILKDNGSFSENIYQRKMVTENRIKGLLGSQERYINGETLLYYEITSRQSIASIYERKSLAMEDIRDFFRQLKIVNDALQKYLLDGRCLVLQPEYVFRNIESGEYTFLYYPDPEENGLSQLLDFFMSRVNAEDLEAVEIVYKIVDLVGREQFVLDEVLAWFQEDVAGNEKIQGRGMPHFQEDGNCKKSDGFLTQPGGDEEDQEYDEESNVSSEKEERTGRAKLIKRLIPIWGAGLLTVCVLIYIQQSFQLSYQERIYVNAGWIITAVMVPVLSLCFFYSDYIKKRDREKEISDRSREVSRYYEPSYEREEHVPVSDVGNTVFIPWTENCENKLYSMDRKNKCHIDLEKLPLTVGKLAGAVDMVINEQSLSRMHARFSRTGKSVYITDLNSTNGTFRNGMRLTPNASEMIEPGDEIRLGKLKFIYR